MGPMITRTVGDVVAELLMSRSAFQGSLLILEGDSDSKFFSRRIAKQSCQIVIAGGKITVIGAIIRIYQIGQAGILGVIDDDYDSQRGIPVPSPHIVRTDSRDIETMLIRSCALEVVLNEFGDQAKITAFELAESATVREALVLRSLIFGKLRLLNEQNQWNFEFGSLSPWRFADVESWKIDEVAVIEFVSAALGKTKEALSGALAALDVADPFVVLHGRDTANILAIGLRSRLGSQQHPVDRVCQFLRLAFDDATAAGTMLFQNIRAWENANRPYRVLA